MKKTSLALAALMISISALPAFANSQESIELPPMEIIAKPVGGEVPASPSFEKNKFEHRGHGGSFRHLDLTQEQKDKIKEIHMAHKNSVKAEIEAVLTPEQNAKLREIMEYKKAKHEKFSERKSHERHFELQQEIADKAK